MSEIALIVGYVVLAVAATVVVVAIVWGTCAFLGRYARFERLLPEYRWTVVRFRRASNDDARALLLSIPGVKWGLSMFLHRQSTLKLIARRQAERRGAGYQPLTP